MFLADRWVDFEVLDVGDGMKLERWGRYVLARPDPQVIWPKAQPGIWQKADATYQRSGGGGQWEFRNQLPDRWNIRYRGLQFYVRPTGFKHTGLFPEQAANWDWMRGRLTGRKESKVLNLFAYTGGATLACAAAGAQVTHVDASKGMTQWARENGTLSGLSEANFRYIIEDAVRFVQREIRRGSRYDGILMDPPSYGRGPTGEVWKLEDELFRLVTLAAQLLSDRPAFFLINGYTTGFQPLVLRNIMDRAITSRIGGASEADEIALPVSSGGVLPCGACARWQRVP